MHIRMSNVIADVPVGPVLAGSLQQSLYSNRAVSITTPIEQSALLKLQFELSIL